MEHIELIRAAKGWALVRLRLYPEAKLYLLQSFGRPAGPIAVGCTGAAGCVRRISERSRS